jgi:hypothetical protein
MSVCDELEQGLVVVETVRTRALEAVLANVLEGPSGIRSAA